MTWFSFLKTKVNITPDMVNQRKQFMDVLTNVYKNQITHLNAKNSPFDEVGSKNDFLFQQYDKLRSKHIDDLETIEELKETRLSTIPPSELEDTLSNLAASKTRESIELSKNLQDAKEQVKKTYFSFPIG
ncbi:unnamed protein product [Ambrosiozyma monospora]|uniref:Unnamed protein product n=1 Tax=Ambrosiozyma monospora TaxID=43982 RepID=A0A9W7DJR9_AMBMO|nr:unnamed protein product [Ambrosiozyma monospora]